MRKAGDAEDLLDLVQQLQRGAARAIELVDEGEDRQAALLAAWNNRRVWRLDAAHVVDDHDDRIDGHERAIGVLGEVFVTGRVDEVEVRPPVSNCMTDELMEMPRSRSIAPKSETTLRPSRRPFTLPAKWMALL